MTNDELFISNNWFAANPNKVLGQTAIANRYGVEKEVIKKDATIGEISSRIISMAEGARPKPQPWMLDFKQPKITTADRVSMAIARTKDLISSPPDIGTLDMIGFDELQKRYGGNATKEEIEVWTFYQRGKLFSDSAVLKPDNGWSTYITPQADQQANIKKWIAAGLLCYDGKEYIPSVVYYAGNIYQKIAKLKERQIQVTNQIGKEAFDRQLTKLENTRPEQLKLISPESERLWISPIDPFCKEVFITQLSDETVFSDETSLIDAFIEWLGTLSQNDFKSGSNEYEISNYYIGSERFRNNVSPAEKIEIKRRAQSDGMQLFSRFLHEALTREDQQIITHRWNSEFNNFAEFDHTRIPIGFEMNRFFKNAPIDPRPALWEGVKFLTINGSGLVAFDVGVGKTMTAILAVAQALYTGQCKRPLIVVPNPTYKKWISECVGEFDKDGKCIVNGVLPQYKDRVNDFYNLGVEYQKKIADNWPQDYSITFITYEGLMNLGFGNAVIDELNTRLFEILNQGLDGRDSEKLREDIDEILGGITGNTVANFDDMGFDYIVVDEAHNFKKIFTKVKGHVDKEAKEDRSASPYQITSGEPSGRGLKLFAMCQYILNRNAMRNVVLLTATPFTNSPLEIYSMLSLVAYQSLKKRGIESLIDFFDKFINEETELSVTIKGKYEPRAVIKTFNNRQVLQNIIFSNIIYKTGEEAGVPRPNKIVLPLLKDEKGVYLPADKVIDTKLQPTTDQEYWLAEIGRFANQQEGNAIEPFVPKSMYDDRGRLLGRDLIAVSLASNCTLSPYLLRIGGEEGVKLFEDTPPTYKEFIESAPKLKYTCECVRTVRDWHLGRNEPVSGQVIYMNMATGYFPMIKEYLVKEIGYAEAEVEIIIGGMGQEKKERIKTNFLNGKVKIIIGSATIREGIDLQNRSTVLYNCALDWNPTDIQQLEGRIWRQGNQHSYVRIVTPMIENSLDVFLFQKLEEKTSRINNIWYRKGRGNVLKLEDFDPKELKMGLMTNPDERVRAEINLELTKVENRLKIIEDNASRIHEAQRAINETVAASDRIESLYTTSQNQLSFAITKLDEWIYNPELSNTKREQYERKRDSIKELLAKEPTEKTKIGVVKRYAKEKMANNNGYDWEAMRMINTCDEQLKRMNLLESISKNVLQPKGLDLSDDLQPIVDEYNAEAVTTKAEVDKLKSDSYFNERLNEVKNEMREKKLLSRSIPERVTEFQTQNHLLSCLKGTHECSTENKVIKMLPAQEAAPVDDKLKRIRLAKAKAKALKLKFEILKLAA